MAGIALFLPDSENPYYRSSADDAMRAAQRHGIPITVEFAEAAVQRQLRQVRTATHAAEPPDAVLIMPVQEAAFTDLSVAAVDGGIGWFWLSRSNGAHSELRARAPRVPVCFITPDQVEAGRLQGRQLAALLGDGGHALYVRGRESNESAQRRGAGFREALVRAGTRIRIAASLEGHWSAADTAQTVADWLRKNVPAGQRVDAVACQSDLMATGAIQALREVAAALKDEKLGMVRVLGIDGLADAGRRMVDTGELAATVILPITTEKAVELAHEFRSKGALPPAEVVLAPRPYPDDATLRGLRFASRAVRR